MQLHASGGRDPHLAWHDGSTQRRRRGRDRVASRIQVQGERTVRFQACSHVRTARTGEHDPRDRGWITGFIGRADWCERAIKGASDVDRRLPTDGRRRSGPGCTASQHREGRRKREQTHHSFDAKAQKGTGAGAMPAPVKSSTGIGYPKKLKARPIRSAR